MKVFDSLKNTKWAGKGFEVRGTSLYVLKSANVFHSLILNSGNYKLRVLGKKRTGSGKINIEVLSDDNEIFLKKEVNFNSNSLSEHTFEFEVKKNIGSSKIKLSREKEIYGSVEIPRMSLDLHVEVEPSEIKSKAGKRKIQKLVGMDTLSFSLSKKIAFIIPYHIYGGAEVYLQNIINHISGHQITFLYLNDNLIRNNLPGFVNHKVIKGLEQLRGFLKSGEYDYIVFYNRLDVYQLLNEMSNNEEILGKLIEIYHSDFIWSGSLSSLKKRERLDKLIVVSKSLGSDIDGISFKQREIIPVGIDLERFNQRENFSLKKSLGIGVNKKILGTVARLSKEKQIDYFIQLAKEMPEYHFVIIGDGPEEKSLKQLTLNLELENVSFVGFQKNVEEYYNIMDGFILASRMEGTPISILEAMASGVPVFTNMVGAISDIVEDGITGFRLSQRPEKDRLIIEKSIEKQDVIKNARRYVEDNHDIIKNANKFLNLLSIGTFYFVDRVIDLPQLTGGFI